MSDASSSDETAPVSGREQEIKLELASESARDALIAALPPARTVKEQFNHYYDFPDQRLRAAGVLLRLRRERSGETERARITVKRGSVRDGAGLFDSAETEADVPLERAAAVIDGSEPFVSLGGPIIEELSRHFGDLAPLSRWGTLENRRSVHPLPGLETLELEIDRASYPDGSILCEVECESTDPEATRRVVVALLEGIPVAFTPSTMSKSERLAHCRPPASGGKEPS